MFFSVHLLFRFSEVRCIPKAFSSVEYVDTRTKQPPTNFDGLLNSVTVLLKNNSVRAPTQFGFVERILVLGFSSGTNVKFICDIQRKSKHVS